MGYDRGGARSPCQEPNGEEAETGGSDTGSHQQEAGKKPYRSTTSIPEYEPDINDLSKYLAPEDMRVIEFLVNAYEESYNEVPFSEHLHKSAINW
ncbi:hypothetical protein CEXT_477211 [Caerostris extrusa]|uniref:Uncharacterized protein n=1 Tax=Caerostris extrusa TaxID=172846 RepID=A0AAV4T7G4_CAEEX|nr:hypothetical protein CEXT_477211 [Caerostris extrusa]